jgi:UDP-glucose 4-epimerase
MRVFVTGGCGFIGSHVVDYLISSGHQVVVLDNLYSGRDHWLGQTRRPQLAIIDLLDRKALSETFSQYKPDAVFHLAAHHYIPFCEENPAAAYDLNVCGTLNVLSEASKSGVDRVFFASTADVYAPSPRPHTEDDALGPFSVYGRTKLIGEMLCRGVADWGWRPNLLIGRIFNAVGLRETNPHLVPEVISQIARGVPELRLGNLYPTRDFVDLTTQACAIVDATFAVRGIETVNIGSGIAVSVGEMINLILSAAECHVKVVVDPKKARAAERSNLCGTTDRLRSLIGYSPDPVGRPTIRAILSEAQAQAPVLSAATVPSVA